MILKKPTFLLVALSLVITLVLAVPQSALAWPSYCPVGYTRVAYYQWTNGGYIIEDGTMGDIIQFDPNSNNQWGRWWVKNPPFDIKIYLVVFTDGQQANTDSISYPNGTYGPEEFFITWNPPHAISNIAFCVPNTPVTLASFTARTNRGAVTINWVTATEINTAGFLLYRSTTVDGPQVQVTTNLIAAQGNGVTGASYAITDYPGYGTFYYWLKDVDYSGQSGLHGPVIVKVLPAIRQPVYHPSLPVQ